MCVQQIGEDKETKVRKVKELWKDRKGERFRKSRKGEN